MENTDKKKKRTRIKIRRREICFSPYY